MEISLPPTLQEIQAEVQKHLKAASPLPALTCLTSSGILRTGRLESVDCCLTCIVGEWCEPLGGARMLLTMPLSRVSG